MNHEQLMRLATDTDAPLPEPRDLSPGHFYKLHPDSPEDHRRARSPGSQDLADLYKAGHGWLVRDGPTRPKAPPCPYCSGPLYTVSEWICECSWEVVTPATDSGCKCNWCVLNRTATPGRGRPRAHCGKPPCAKAYKRERNRANYLQRIQTKTL